MAFRPTIVAPPHRERPPKTQPEREGADRWRAVARAVRVMAPVAAARPAGRHRILGCVARAALGSELPAAAVRQGRAGGGPVIVRRGLFRPQFGHRLVIRGAMMWRSGPTGARATALFSGARRTFSGAMPHGFPGQSGPSGGGKPLSCGLSGRQQLATLGEARHARRKRVQSSLNRVMYPSRLSSMAFRLEAASTTVMMKWLPSGRFSSVKATISNACFGRVGFS